MKIFYKYEVDHLRVHIKPTLRCHKFITTRKLVLRRWRQKLVQDNGEVLWPSQANNLICRWEVYQVKVSLRTETLPQGIYWNVWCTDLSITFRTYSIWQQSFTRRSWLSRIFRHCNFRSHWSLCDLARHCQICLGFRLITCAHAPNSYWTGSNWTNDTSRCWNTRCDSRMHRRWLQLCRHHISFYGPTTERWATENHPFRGSRACGHVHL